MFGFCHFRVIEYMFAEVDKHIDAGDLISEFRMSALPILYGQFVELIKYLVILDVCTVEYLLHSWIVKTLTSYVNCCS